MTKRVKPKGKDEVSRLANTFNHLAESLESQENLTSIYEEILRPRCLVSSIEELNRAEASRLNLKREKNRSKGNYGKGDFSISTPVF